MRWKNIVKVDGKTEETFKALRKTESSWKCEKDREVERIKRSSSYERNKRWRRSLRLLQREAYCSNRMLRRSPLLIRTIQSFSWNRASRSAFPPLSSLFTNKPSVLEQSQHILVTLSSVSALFPDQQHHTLLSKPDTQAWSHKEQFNGTVQLKSLSLKCNSSWTCCFRDIMRHERPLQLRRLQIFTTVTTDSAKIPLTIIVT